MASSINTATATPTNNLTPQETATNLFTNSTILAPMVRASTTPLRILALHHGATLTYTEELIDRSMLDNNIQRIVNTDLGTIDYVKPLDAFPKKVQKRMLADVSENPDSGRGAVLLRIDQELERDRLIYQIGTGESGLAVRAIEKVVGDVAGVDVNMGCPKKFSVSGGMGSALLSDPKRACDIISTLRRNISKPVSAKIRLLDPTDPRPTLDFVHSLIQAGANAITIHGRIVGDESQTDARWDTLVEVVKLLKEKESVPIIINGDLYTHQDIREMKRRTGCDGVMLARPALYNMSLFHREEEKQTNGDVNEVEDEMPLTQFQTSRHEGYYGYNSPLLQSRKSVIQEYVSQCVRYRTHSKNAKYVVCEMMNSRRAPTSRVPFLNMALDGPTVDQVCKCRSLNDLVKIWDVKRRIPLPSNASGQMLSADISGEGGGMGDLHNYSDDYFLNPEKFHKERAAKLEDSGDEKKTDEATAHSMPVAKRPKL